jgi:uncharacterized YccA/Bax inhibitor family protein
MSNPVLSGERWDEVANADRPVSSATSMTVNGTVMKTGVLLLFLITAMGWMWSSFWNHGQPDMHAIYPWFIGGAIGGLVLCLIGMFVPKIAFVFAPLYAVAEGLFLGGLTMYIQSLYPKSNLPLLAASFTTACVLGMLMLYMTGIIKATPGFVRGVMIATVGLALGMGILMLLNMFGVGGGIAAALGGSGPIGIIFSIFCVGLAAFNLVVDFGFIEQGARQGQPKYMEWVGAFGLLVTLVWLYVEILILLMKLQRRD